MTKNSFKSPGMQMDNGAGGSMGAPSGGAGQPPLQSTAALSGMMPPALMGPPASSGGLTINSVSKGAGMGQGSASPLSTIGQNSYALGGQGGVLPVAASDYGGGAGQGLADAAYGPMLATGASQSVPGLAGLGGANTYGGSTLPSKPPLSQRG